MSSWVTAQASVIGHSHTKSRLPCQDASVVKTSPDGQWLVVVVSDGAGTAAKAEVGSKLVSEFFANELLDLVQELQNRPPGHWINDFVIARVLDTRAALRKLAKSDDIRDYNCTLVACLQGPSGGFSIHIGDGSIIGGTAMGNSESLQDSLFLSPPENGEYSNETFFITEGDWVKHLRVTPMPKLEWVMCCTDGGGDLALVADKEPKNGFLKPVVFAVFQEKDKVKRNAVLAEFLEDPQADKATSDDKTIVFAVKEGCQNQFSDVFIAKDLQTNSNFVSNLPITTQQKANSNISKAIIKNPILSINKIDRPRSLISKILKLLFWLLATLTLVTSIVILVFKFDLIKNKIKAAVVEVHISNESAEEIKKNELTNSQEKDSKRVTSARLIRSKPEEKTIENGFSSK